MQTLFVLIIFRTDEEMIRRIQQTGPLITNPDSKVHWANMGPIWGRQDPGGPDVGPMNFVIREEDAVLLA